jgi:hypothetical protein
MRSLLDQLLTDTVTTKEPTSLREADLDVESPHSI